MPIERSSTSLVRYLGATVKANTSSGKLSNVVSNGQGRERGRNPSVRRLSSVGLVQDSIKISEYQSALGYLESRGVSPLISKTMASVFVDAAKSQGQSVMALLESSNAQALALVNKAVIQRINQLRDGTTQLSSSNPSNNALNSTKARLIQP